MVVYSKESHTLESKNNSTNNNNNNNNTQSFQTEVRVLNNRAYCLAKLERFVEAVDDYSRVIKAEPKNSHALHNRGLSLDKLGRHDEGEYDVFVML